MSKGELFRRYFVFFISLWVNALGVSIVTVAALGTTPISSLWYEISLHVPLTFGMVTFLGNLLLIISQFFMLKERSRIAYINVITQLPATLLFAASIDLNMFWLNVVLPPLDYYVMRFALLLCGTLILACGVAVAVKADVALVAGEGFVKTLCKFVNKEFGLIKTCFDVSLVIGAVIIGLLATGFERVESVREGTLVGALMVGPCVRIISPHLGFLDIFFRGRKALEEERAKEQSGFFPAITISREYGCGGRVLGRELAKALNLKFYDSDLIEMVAKETGLTKEFVSRNENRLDNALLYEMIFQDYSAPLDKSLSPADALYAAAGRVIRRLCKEGPCVIVGRGADALLHDNPYCLNVRLHAPFEDKLRFCQEVYHLTKEKALKDMQLFDKRRAEHYQHYTGRSISDERNYDLVLNSASLGLKGCAQIIKEAFALKQEQHSQREEPKDGNEPAAPETAAKS
ncbi:MAG: cytidylate kinase family protein [Proteobacteria bacterium]|uniref:Cytidylate kinase family protein n=1 Tax=Candidatus Avisuccinivibrio stercorigallinarum TaxID=2840704 RepID=A0A9D9DAU1_9GAMM|nr:cytidylate kinase family protein [Candidatus Avisuccinivibrio stercorigallinarum]